MFCWASRKFSVYSTDFWCLKLILDDKRVAKRKLEDDNDGKPVKGK